MIGTATAQGLRYLGLSPAVTCLDSNWIAGHPDYRSNVRAITACEGCEISDLAEVISRAFERLFGLEIANPLRVTFNVESTEAAQGIRGTHTGQGVFAGCHPLRAVEATSPLQFPLAYLRPVSEPGFSSLPEKASEQFISSLDQRGINQLMLSSVRRSSKSPDGVSLVAGSNIGDGPGTMLRLAAMQLAAYRAGTQLVASDLEVKADSSGNSSQGLVVTLQGEQLDWVIEHHFSEPLAGNGVLVAGNYYSANFKTAVYLNVRISPPGDVIFSFVMPNHFMPVQRSSDLYMILTPEGPQSVQTLEFFFCFSRFSPFAEEGFTCLDHSMLSKKKKLGTLEFGERVRKAASWRK